MDPLLDAHPVTVITVVAALLVTPFYLLCTYVFSGASPRKGAVMGALFLAWGAVMTQLCLTDVTTRLGAPGQLVVPLCWAAPSVALFLARRWALAEPLSQHWLVGLQLWRAIGAVFLLELARGELPAVFALPAGVGDVLVAVVALAVLLSHRSKPNIDRGPLLLVLTLGVLDFLSAFFFGFTSSEGPQQLFAHDFPNRVLLWPTGMIPLFLVPYAIFFHVLSWLNWRRHGEGLPGR